MAKTTVRAVMFGGARAGKTSLLASMYDVLDDEVTGAGLELSPDLRTDNALNQARGQLAEILTAVAQGDGRSDIGVVRNDPDAPPRRYKFDLGNGEVDVARLVFTDYAGERLDRLADDHDVMAEISTADALVVAINTPPLMAADRGGDWKALHQRANHPDTLARLLKDHLKDTPPLVFFCPLKCERWIQDDASGKTLYNAVQKAYAKALNALQQKHSATQAWFIPIETVGGVIFDRFATLGSDIEPTGYTAREVWVPRATGATFAPARNEQPLRHLMTHLVGQITYGTMAAAHDKAADDPNKGIGDVVGHVIQAGLNYVAHAYDRTRLPKLEPVEEFFDDAGGRGDFKNAGAVLAKGRSEDPPIYRLR